MAARTGAIRAGRAFVELFADDSALVRGLRAARYKLRRFGRSVSQLGRRMLGLATAIATPIGLGVREYGRFEEQLARVSTMVDDTGAHMDRFRKALSDMAVEFGVSTETLAGGLYDILSAQIPASQALDVLREGTKGAIGGFADAKTSTSALITILEAYGDQLRDAADASDFLFSVVKRGRLTYEDLASNLGKVAPSAAAAGVSVEEFGAALALITRGMPDTDNATTALANVIETFMKNTDVAKEMAKKLGIEMSTAGLRSDGLLYVIRQLARGDPDTVAKVFPRRRALRGLIIAVQKAEELGVDIEAMTNRAGAAEEAYQKMAHTPLRELARLWEAVKKLGRTIGEAIGGTVKLIAIDLKALIMGIADWVKENRELVTTLVKVVVVVGAVGALLIGLGTSISLLAFALGGLATAASVIGTVMGALAAVIGALMSPIGAVVVAVAALGAYLLHVSGAGAKALGWLGERFSSLKEDALAAFGGIKDALVAGDLGLAAKILWLTLKVEWEKGIRPLKIAWHKFTFGLEAAFEIVTNALVKLWLGLTYKLQEYWARFSGWLKKTHSTVTDWIAKRILDVQGMFDKGFDVDLAKRMVDEAGEAERRRIDRERQQRVQSLEDEHSAAQKLLADEHQRRLANISEEHDERVAAAEEVLAKTREEWKAAIAAARKKREAREAGEPPAPGEPQSDPAKIREMLENVGTTIERGLSVRGTFSAVAAWGLGTGNAMDRTARASEETARNTRKLTDQAAQGQLIFT